MIRFFRTLRQRLLSENRVSKYLFYAMQTRLINEALVLISHNQRQIMLYHSIQDEIKKLHSILEAKCP